MTRGISMLLLVLAAIGGVLAWKAPRAFRALREARLAVREHETVVGQAEQLADLRSKEHVVFASRRATSDLVAQLGVVAQSASQSSGQVRITSFDPMGEARIAIPALAHTDMDVMRQSVRIRLQAADMASLGRFLQMWSDRGTRWQPSSITLTLTRTTNDAQGVDTHEYSSVEADMVLATTFVESRTHGTR